MPATLLWRAERQLSRATKLALSKSVGKVILKGHDTRSPRHSNSLWLRRRSDTLWLRDRGHAP